MDWESAWGLKPSSSGTLQELLLRGLSGTELSRGRRPCCGPRVPDRPLGKGGMVMDQSTSALGPWGCACPFQALPSRGCSVLGLCALLSSQAPRGACGRGCGCERPPWQPPSSTATAGFLPVKLSLAHCAPPPRPPGAPPSSRRARPLPGVAVGRGNHAGRRRQGWGSRAESPPGGPLTCAQTSLPGWQGLLPKSHPGSPQAHRRRSPRLPGRPRACSLRLWPRCGCRQWAGYLEPLLSCCLQGGQWSSGW